MFKKFLFTFFFLIVSFELSSKSLNFEGLKKLSINDIQSITSIDIFNNNIKKDDLNIILKELSLSDLIYDLNYYENEDFFILNIIESDSIESIYIINNTWIEDDLILQNLESKNNLFSSKNSIQKDINIIESIYKSKGFKNVNVVAKVERFSESRVNLIYEIKENKQLKINYIKFVGNNFFSSNFLNSQIKSESIRFYNIFKRGSNFNYSTFEFDKNIITTLYKNEGFNNAKVSFTLEKSSINNTTLYFYIDEGSRSKIKQIDLEITDEKIYDLINSKYLSLKNKIKKNNNFYSKKIIFEYLEKFNSDLISNNINNKTIDMNIIDNENDISILFFTKDKDPIIISKINITGNSITKSKTIRSKLSIEPGEYLSKYKFDKSINTLKTYPYITDVKSETIIKDNLADITINIEEQKKTGNVLVAGTFNADTGAGLNFGIEDKNIFGSGNSISSDFLINSEDIKFNINYVQYPILNPNLTNTYTIFNQDNDYTKSYGYKATRRGLGYFINFDQNDKLRYGVGINYESFKGHSAINSTSSSINDNIGNFENYNVKFSIKYNSINDRFNPSNGHINNLDIIISPETLSDNSFYKFIITNKNYRELKRSKNYIFLNNKYGFSKSLNSKLKTIDTFALGGLNFKGFDYRGIGPYDGNIYLGGNEFFTSTIGYGSSFLFDDKDNINVKFFLTTGSIWNSDYSSSNDIDIRSSIGTSFDFITPVGPISFSYAVPIEKNTTDRPRSFNFSIGTSF